MIRQELIGRQFKVVGNNIAMTIHNRNDDTNYGIVWIDGEGNHYDIPMSYSVIHHSIDTNQYILLPLPSKLQIGDRVRVVYKSSVQLEFGTRTVHPSEDDCIYNGQEGIILSTGPNVTTIAIRDRDISVWTSTAELIESAVIDYKIPGTRIPQLRRGMLYDALIPTNWSRVTAPMIDRARGTVSFGTYILNGEVCIKFENPGYTGNSHFIVKLSELQALTPIQPAIEPEFVLPQQWHCIVTEENQEVLSKWRFGREVSRRNLLNIGYIVGITKNIYNTGYEIGHNRQNDIGGPDQVYDFGIELTYQQFLDHVLGEIPFILPERWCIKATSENIEDIGGFYNTRTRNNFYNHENNIGSYFHSHNLRLQRLGNDNISILSENPGANFIENYIIEGYTEITYEQFKKYILKKSVEDKASEILSSKLVEKDLPSEIEVINPAKGFSMSQFAQALESIPWMEKDDAKDIYKEVEKHFKSIKIEEEQLEPN